MYSNFENIKSEKQFKKKYLMFKKCKHYKKWLYSKYYNLYECEHCNNYIILVFDSFKGRKYHYELPIIWFSDNDDRIISIDYESQQKVEHERRKAYYRTEDGKKWKQILKQQSKAYCKKGKHT